MKKSKKLIAVLMTAILGSAIFLTGCGEKPVAADVTVKAFYNLYLLGDSSEIEKIALTKDEVTQVLDKLKTESQSATRNNLLSVGTPTTEQLDAIYNAQMESLKKLTVTTEIVSEDEDNATVKLRTTYIDQLGIDKKAAIDAANEVNAMGLANLTEWNNKLLEVYTNKLVEGLKAAQPSTETKEDTFECEKKTYEVNNKNKDIFAPKDMVAFGESVAKMATNQ